MKHIVNSLGMDFTPIPSGAFNMGSVNGDQDEQPVHQVTLTEGFHLGTHPVTQRQYEKLMGENLSTFRGLNYPVERVSWNDAIEFCRRLSEQNTERDEGRVYRLPTEAEWEYACRGAAETRYCFGDEPSELESFGWFKNNSDGTTHAVGLKEPNRWNLYDMHGNVWEWCQDWLGAYPSESPINPLGPEAGTRRIFRGGSWRDDPDNCTSSFRLRLPPTSRYCLLGFRVHLQHRK
ncbi:formylglycine-generating enzyme family protein [bacterium]|nr:formylglycine-generating enzyme family protein [Rubripirellula sp.]MDB4654373.1 formylglycine-generating enzyme family protein [Rubripirellula sp.]MDC0317679.1 formylglycine-generating enzyme family protein [bacterium]